MIKRSIIIFKIVIFVILLYSVTIGIAGEGNKIAIKGGKIYTITNGIIDKGIILIDGQKITAVGKDIAIPPEYKVIDASGLMVFPGFIDNHSHLGGLNDINEMVESYTPEMLAVDAWNLYEDELKSALSGGVTTIIFTPGSGNVICGVDCAIKLAGKTFEEAVISKTAGLKFALEFNPVRNARYPTSKMGVIALIEDKFDEALLYKEKWEVYKNQSNGAEKPEYDERLEIMVKALNGDLICRFHVASPSDVYLITRIVKKYNLKANLIHGHYAWKMAKELAENNIAVSCGSITFYKDDRTLRNAGKLFEAGVFISINTDAPVMEQQYLALSAAMVVKYGLPEEEGLKAITINSAKIAGIDDRVGSIEVGKDADILLMTGHPFDIMSKVITAFINGKIVYKK